MKNALKYLNEVLGIYVTANPIAKSNLGQLPIYVIETFKLYNISLFNKEVVFAELKNDESFSVHQIDKQLQQINKQLNKIVVVVLENIQAYNRKRLIEKHVNFIVPGKQMYLPDLLIDLRESYHRYDTKKETLLPSAQLLLIYQILSVDLNWKIEEHPFKDIAQKFGYTPMTITKAIANLKSHELIDVFGEKEKFIRFRYDKKALWEKVQNENLFVNPVLKTVFVDEKPKGLLLLKSNTSAFPTYTNLNPSNQQYYAIEKDEFYALQKSNELVNANPTEGKYALEIWKYKPLNIVDGLTVVDPLSLYLSVYDINDERIAMALDQILKKYVW
jgi:DNA-binding MarR family transcriptional regulator